MSRLEINEEKAIAKITNGRQSAAYRTARRHNIPVTVARGEIIYLVTNEGSKAIGRIAPKVKIKERVVKLER